MVAEVRGRSARATNCAGLPGYPPVPLNCKLFLLRRSARCGRTRHATERRWPRLWQAIGYCSEELMGTSQKQVTKPRCSGATARGMHRGSSWPQARPHTAFATHVQPLLLASLRTEMSSS